MGYLTKNVIVKVKLNDLKGKYIGHTAHMTQKAIDSATGGILVIDEGYALGSEEKLDSFSKEIIDTINRNLTEKAGKFICILAGYADKLDKCLLAHNPGLASRFRFRFSIEPYNASELKQIFDQKVIKDKWSYSEDINEIGLKKFFADNYDVFKYYGRDMETLLYHTKVAHCNRVFFEPKESTKKITNKDIQLGFDRFIMHQKSDSKSDEIMSDSIKHIYT